MMMPANFTAVNSEVVYGGASLLETLGAVTAPVWNAGNVKTFNTNLITIVGNTFISPLVQNTLGVMFSGNWGDDNKLTGDDGKFSGYLKNEAAYDSNNKFIGFTGDEMNGTNKFMRILGTAAAIYNLGTGTVSNAAAGRIYIDGKAEY